MARRFTWDTSAYSNIDRAFGDLDEYERIRKTVQLQMFMATKLAEPWVDRLNVELHAAQAARHQPIADGYGYQVDSTGSRSRVYIIAMTARAQAHEKAHNSILRQMPT